MRPSFTCLLASLALTCLACDKSKTEDTIEPVAAPPADAQPADAQPADAQPIDPALTGILDEEGFKALHELTGEQAPAPTGETLTIAGSSAYLALPSEAGEAPLPAVIVIHEWWGLNDHIRHWTDRLAEDGYAALAVDLYGGQVASDPDGAMNLMKAVDPAAAQAILSAAHTYLTEDPRIRADKQGVIGWCFGGGWSLRHAIATPDLDAAVIYYGHPQMDPDQLGNINAALLGVFANQDTSIPPETVDGFAEALEEAGKSIELHRYDAVHAFANPSNAKYDQDAAADAWSHVRAFLDAQLRGQGQ